MSKIIYIMGCGRSGSTLLGILLGNNKAVFDAGEIIKFPELRGRPHGFSEDTPNFQFWKAVEKEMFLKEKFEYGRLFAVSRNIEAHVRFVLYYLGFLPRKLIREYTSYINALFATVFDRINERVIIDSSKYPGRALALNNCFSGDLYIIYLQRNLSGVVKSFQKRNVEQSSKSILNAVIYYFVISFFCKFVELRIDKSRFIRIKYEDLIVKPEAELLRIQNKFSIDLSESIVKARNNDSFKTGYIFEGNRIRLNEEIKLRQSVKL